MSTPIPPNEAEITAWEIAALTSGVVRKVNGEGRKARGVTTDSRAVVAGGAFVALRGEIHDGHRFVEAAVKAGAVIAVVERGSDVSAPGADVVEVPDTLAAWGAIARLHLDRWRRRAGERPARTLCITGSAGKTTTKELCAALLAQVGPTLSTPGNLNNRIGLPAVAFTVNDAIAYTVLEAGMSLPGEIAELASIARPDVGLVTNVGLAHAEGVGGTRSHVGREKGALYAALSANDHAIVNADDGAAMGQAARTRARDIRTFGRAKGATYKLIDRVALGLAGSRVTIERPCGDCASPSAREIVELRLPLVGEVAALDLCSAIAAAEATIGRPLAVAEMEQALDALGHVGGRAAAVELEGDVVVIDDSYNANPGSVRAALGTLADLAGSTHRMICVLGEMKELGPSSADEHESLGGAIAAARVAVLVTCGGLATKTAHRAAEAGVDVRIASDSDEGASLLLDLVQPGDVVLVKGSRSVKTEIVVRALVASRGRKEGT